MTKADCSLRASIVIPMYNAGGFIASCLESVLRQTVSPAEYEIIVVDDGSTDGSAEQVETRFPGVRILRSPKNLGFARAANLGAREARGRWVIFLNVDTCLAEDWLAQLLAVAESDERIGGVQTVQIFPWRRLEGAAENMPYYLDLCPWGFTRYYLLAGQLHPIPTLFLSGAGCAVRRQWLEQHGPAFDPSYRMYGEDRDLALRLAVQGYRLYTVPRAKLWHKHPNPLSNPKVGLRKANLAARNGWRAYLKNMYLTEFLLFAPILLAGSFLRAWEFPAPWWRRLAAGLGYFLLTLAYFLPALWFYLVLHPEERRQNLRRRTQPRGWLIKRLLTPPSKRTWS